MLFFYAFRGTPETEALAINAKGQLSKMTPLNINDPSLPRIIATDALSNMFQFTKESYPQQMEWNKSYFVDDGYNKYIKTLQDLNFYNFVSDAIQNLCEKANVKPCLFDASVFIEGDKGEWTLENSIF